MSYVQIRLNPLHPATKRALHTRIGDLEASKMYAPDFPKYGCARYNYIGL
jgi:hypothetical protein